MGRPRIRRPKKTDVAPSMRNEPLDRKILAYVANSPGATLQELATNFQSSTSHVRKLVRGLRHNRLVKCRKVDGRLEVRAAHPAVWDLRDENPRTIHAVSLFCGLGGGDEALAQVLRAMGYDLERDVDVVGINHDEAAIRRWKENHPFGRECREDITLAQPRKLFPGGKLKILIAGPSCTHHSTARGGRPVSDQMRSHPWAVVRWARDLDIEFLVVENVGNIVSWGPTHVVDCAKCLAKDGQADPKCRMCGGCGRTEVPVPGKEGTIFRQWLRELKRLGYSLDWRIVNAADYGDAQTRKRFFLMAHKGTHAISWPTPTHSKVDPKTGKPSIPGTKPWRAAREIIDFSLPSESIFDRAKPLVPKTLKRMYDGLERQNPWIRPFLVMLRGTGTTGSIDSPLPTLTAGGTHVGLCQPIVLGQQSGAVGRGLDQPLNTVATGGAISLTEPTLTSLDPLIMAAGGPLGQQVPVSTEQPLRTVLGTTHLGIIQASLEPVVVPPDGPGGNGSSNHAKSVDDPLCTVRASRGDRIGLAEPTLVQFNGRSDAQPVSEPLPTQTTRDRFGLVEPVLVDCLGSKDDWACRAKSVEGPLPTNHAGGMRCGIAEASLAPVILTTDRPETNRSLALGLDEPLPTAVANHDRIAMATPVLAEPILVPNFGERDGQRPRYATLQNPLPTVTGHGAGGLVEAQATPTSSRVQWVNGRPCIDGWMLDIRFRMLEPHELAASMSFPAHFRYGPTKREAIRQIGNAWAICCGRAIIGALLMPKAVNLLSFSGSPQVAAAA